MRLYKHGKSALLIKHCKALKPTNVYKRYLKHWSRLGNCKNYNVLFYWNQLFLVDWVGLVLSCSNGEKPFSVGLVDKLFQPASNQVETVEKAFVLLCRVIVARVRAIRRSYRAFQPKTVGKVFYGEM